MWAALYAAFLVQIYHFILYPALLYALPKPRRAKGHGAGLVPAKSVSVIVCAYNEAGVIADKIANLMALEPPPAEIIVVTDGSNDGTEEVARGSGSGRVPLIVDHQPERRGKSHAMNRAVGLASSEILCFNDANTTLSTDALAHLLNEFHDETVALVSGAKHVTSAAAGADQSVATGDGAYWRYESAIRRQESLLGATVSVVGEILAIRAADWTDIPDGVVNDDAWIAMRMLSDRRNVRYAPRAESWELATPSTPLEVARRRRINAGRLRLIMRRDAWPLTRPFVLLAFLSHKVLRLLLPFLFTVSFVTSVVLATGEDGSTASALIAALHVAALLFAGLHIVLRPLGLRWKLASVAFHVLSAYASVLLAHYDVARGKQHVLWSKQAR